MTRPWVRPLTEAYAQALAPHVSEEDRRDLVASGFSPELALRAAMDTPGEAWAAGVEEDHVLGAFGWTRAGAIWSMWRLLTRGEQRALLRLTPQFVQAMALDAGRPLGNVVDDRNERIISWLKASGCFEFLEQKVLYNGRTYVPFVVRPQGDLSSV